MLRTVIIDDEQAGIGVLQMLSEQHRSRMRVIAAAQTPEEGIRLIEDFRPDVVFLDISMPKMNGFELLSRLTYRGFRLVFTTAHRDFAIDAIRSKAFDYLLKPIDVDDFRRCVDDLTAEAPCSQALKSKQPLLELQVKDGIHYIKHRQIVRLEASRSYTIVHLDGGIRHVASRSLKEFETKLDDRSFFRCHHSHIVNLRKVQKFVSNQGYFALMEDGSMADIAKKSKESFLERLKAL